MPGERTIAGKLGRKGIVESRVQRHGLAPGGITRSSHVHVSACVHRNSVAFILTSAAAKEGIPGEQAIARKFSRKRVVVCRVGPHGRAPGSTAVSSHVHVPASVYGNGGTVITSAVSKEGVPGE